MNILFTGVTGNLLPWFNYFSSNYCKNDALIVISRNFGNKELEISNKCIKQDLSKKFTLNEKIDILVYGACLLPYERSSHEINHLIKYNEDILNNTLNAFTQLPRKIIFFSTNLVSKEFYYTKENYIYSNLKSVQEKNIYNFCKENNIIFITIRFPPFVNSVLDNKYEIKKLKKKIAIFPLSHDFEVECISSYEQFAKVLDYCLKKVSCNTIIEFDNISKYTYKDKINDIKKILHLNSFVLFTPIKKKYKPKTNNLNMLIIKWKLELPNYR